MQPYFMPYAGYFRLFAAADLVVLFDCVQFPRRGRVHRNILPLADGRAEWLTLPVAASPRHTRISEIRFNEEHLADWPRRLDRFPSLREPADPERRHLQTVVRNIDVGFVDFLTRGLAETCKSLMLPFNVVRSSDLDMPAELVGEERVIAIVEALGGSVYVNSPGGLSYYNPDLFRRRGIELKFLAPFGGSNWSILHRLMVERCADVALEVRRETQFL